MGVTSGAAASLAAEIGLATPQGDDRPLSPQGDDDQSPKKKKFPLLPARFHLSSKTNESASREQQRRAMVSPVTSEDEDIDTISASHEGSESVEEEEEEEEEVVDNDDEEDEEEEQVTKTTDNPSSSRQGSENVDEEEEEDKWAVETTEPAIESVEEVEEECISEITGQVVFSLRLDVDCVGYPPDSSERANLRDNFAADVSRVLKDSAGTPTVRVVDIRPAVDLDWLTIVDFEVECVPGEVVAKKLQAALSDTGSIIYAGDVTAFVDCEHGLELRPAADTVLRSETRAALSPEPAVAAILLRYAGDRTAEEVSFNVTLRFGGRRRQFRVLDPFVLRRSACWVWPQDVLETIGFKGVSAPWVDVVSLTPTTLGLAPHLATALPFTPQPRFGGLTALAATLLRRDAEYDVQVRDRRLEAFDRLDDADRAKLREIFAKLGVNTDDDDQVPIRRPALEATIKKIATDARTLVDDQHSAYVEGFDTDNQCRALDHADAVRAHHRSTIGNAEQSALANAALADANGTGLVSKIDCALIIAAWIQTTLDPNKFQLF